MEKQINLDVFFNSIPSAWTGHRHFAKWIANEISANVIVDLGVDYGYSTFCFALSSAREIYGIDSFEGDGHTGFRSVYDKLIENLEFFKNKFDIHTINIIKGDFNEVAKTWDKKIDILHIDGFHTYAAVKNDYETWSPFLSDNSVVLFHDTQSFPDINKFFYELSGYKVEFKNSAGLGVLSNNEETIMKIKSTWIF